MQKYLLIVFLIVFPLLVNAQVDTNIWMPAAPAHYAFVHYTDNSIGQPDKLDSVFKKLVALHTTRKGKVSIVHIGDSHIQGDGITSVLRDGFRKYFGDAGRGLVFPYQLASSNAPHDVSSSSNTSWKNNRLTNPNSPIATGICGYAIQSEKENAAVHIQLKDMDGHQESFDRMVFFLGKEKSTYDLTDSSPAIRPSIETHQGIDAPSLIFETDSPITNFKLTRTVSTPGTEYSFYGVSLEHKEANGVIYHTIGVNGARYDQYVQDDLFWEQLAALNGDLFIISMGTNEAQNRQINEQGLMAVCDSFVRKIHRIAPGASILITTPAGSYYKMKKPNASVLKVSNTLVHFCQEKGFAFWDLDKISGGKTSAIGWRKSNLMSHDFVHYNGAGYQLQGDLLMNAIAKAYNSYAKQHPYKTPKPASENAIPKKPGTKKAAPSHTDTKQKVNDDEEIMPKGKPASKFDSIPPPHTKKLKVDYSG